MAQKLGIKRSLLGAYEEARANPRLEVLVKAAEIFNVSVDQLVSETLSKPLQEKATHRQIKREVRQEALHSLSTDMAKPERQESASAAIPLATSINHTVENLSANPYRQEGQESSARPYLPPRKIEFTTTKDKKFIQQVPLVPEKDFKQYFYHAVEPDYLNNLLELSLLLPAGQAQYRAFEVADEAMSPVSKGAIVVGRLCEGIQRLQDGKPHVLITRTEGVLFRRVYNHIEKSGYLLLEANHKAYDRIKLPVMGKEVEAWEVVLFISDEDPYQYKPQADYTAMDMAQLTTAVKELQREVRLLKESR